MRLSTDRQRRAVDNRIPISLPRTTCAYAPIKVLYKNLASPYAMSANPAPSIMPFTSNPNILMLHIACTSDVRSE